jgi:hypothetical protein
MPHAVELDISLVNREVIVSKRPLFVLHFCVRNGKKCNALPLPPMLVFCVAVDAPRLRIDALEPIATTPAAVVVLQALIGLEAQLVDVRRWSAQLDAAYGVGKPQRALEAMLGLRQVLPAVAVRYARIRRHVVAFDGAVLGHVIGSFGELGIRAQIFVIAAQLAQLRSAVIGEVGRSAGDAGQRADAGDRASTFDEIGTLLCVGAMFHQTFDKVTNAFATESIRRVRARYHAGVLRAERDIAALADVPTVATFLADGMANQGRPAVQSACTLTVAALSCRLGSELDSSRWVGSSLRRLDTAAAHAFVAGGVR